MRSQSAYWDTADLVVFAYLIETPEANPGVSTSRFEMLAPLKGAEAQLDFKWFTARWTCRPAPKDGTFVVAYAIGARSSSGTLLPSGYEVVFVVPVTELVDPRVHTALIEAQE